MKPPAIMALNETFNPKNKTTKHDESGQVFTEVSCPGGPMTSDWEWKTQGSSREALRSVSSYTGCSSLVNMAVRSALSHSKSISAETLKELPWEIASLLWESLVASYARSWHLAGTDKAD